MGSIGLRGDPGTFALEDLIAWRDNGGTIDIERIQKILKNSGYYFSTVTDKIIENKNNTVNLIFEIVLGEKAYIQSIEFTGDKYYKDRLLRNIIVSEENISKFLSDNAPLDTIKAVITINKTE